MRTTLDLPDALAQRAKIAAVRRGLSLRALVAQALDHELASSGRPVPSRPLELPVIRSGQPASYDLNPAQIADILLREECAAYEAAQRR
jgi:hypothetical protein